MTDGGWRIADTRYGTQYPMSSIRYQPTAIIDSISYPVSAICQISVTQCATSSTQHPTPQLFFYFYRMDKIRLHDMQFRPYIPAEVIQQRIREIAAEINHDLKYDRPLFIGILNGVFMFAGELMKELTIECEITFVKLSSYAGTLSTGTITEIIGLNVDVKGRNIVVLDDIIDTGKTLNEFLLELSRRHPESIRVAALLFKPECLEYDIEINYLGFKVPNDFLVGFGLDYDELGRNLKDIHVKC
jgi:hypoxanthine phosphoribosyltransferase